MSAEKNKAIVLRYFEESHNQHKLAIMDELCDPAYAQDHKTWQMMELAAFPDKQFTVDDVVAEGDKVVLRWTIRGTHRGPFGTPFGTVAPTGRQIAFQSILIYRVENGRIMEEWHFPDWLGLLQQFGAEVTLAGVTLLPDDGDTADSGRS